MRFRNTLIAISAAAAFVFAGISVANATNCGQVFPTGLNGYTTGCTIPSGWANALEDKIGINQSNVTSSLDYQINHIFTSWGSEEIASSAIPWLSSSTATTTIAIGSSTVNGPAFILATSTASGKWTIAASGTTITFTLPSNVGFFTNDAGYLTANQSITWTAAGDISGSASGATTITPSLTVTGLDGKALPSLATGTLQYIGGAWKINEATSSLGLYDASGNLSSYGGSNCPASEYGTGLSATGTVACGTSLASTTINFNIWNATTTAPNYGDAQTLSKLLVTSISCSEAAASATDTVEVYYNTTLASSGIQQAITSSTISCTSAGTSTTIFATSTIPAGAYVYAAVSSTAGTPTLTSLYINATKE